MGGEVMSRAVRDKRRGRLSGRGNIVAYVV